MSDPVIFAVAVGAVRNVPDSHGVVLQHRVCAFHCVASSADEARAFGLRRAEGLWPPVDGWSILVSVLPVAAEGYSDGGGL